MKLTVTFDLNDLEWESVKKIAAFSAGWHWANLQIRHNGETKTYEADFMQQFFNEVRKAANLPVRW